MNYNDFFALAENKGINRIQVTETYIKQNEIQFIDKNLEKYNISEHLDYYIKAERNNKTEKVKELRKKIKAPNPFRTGAFANSIIP